MRSREQVVTLSATSPTNASTVIGPSVSGAGTLSRAELLVIDATIAQTTGGTLDVYLQRKTAANTWRDWVHFPQVAAGVAKNFTFVVNGEGSSSISDVGVGSDASAGVSLAANSFVNCLPNGDVRVVFVAGTSTSAGAAVTVQIQPMTELH